MRAILATLLAIWIGVAVTDALLLDSILRRSWTTRAKAVGSSSWDNFLYAVRRISLDFKRHRFDVLH